MNNQLPQLILGDVIVPVPVIQGGMGVGVSRSRLAGAVAKEGGIGVISTAQIGYDEENFEKNPAECNCRAIIKHIAQAKEIAGGNGLVGVNIMVALKHYRQHIETAVEAGADVIICGAGLPADLPGIAQNYAREHGEKDTKADADCVFRESSGNYFKNVGPSLPYGAGLYYCGRTDGRRTSWISGKCIGKY